MNLKTYLYFCLSSDEKFECINDKTDVNAILEVFSLYLDHHAPVSHLVISQKSAQKAEKNLEFYYKKFHSEKN